MHVGALMHAGVMMVHADDAGAPMPLDAGAMVRAGALMYDGVLLHAGASAMVHAGASMHAGV